MGPLYYSREAIKMRIIQPSAELKFPHPHTTIGTDMVSLVEESARLCYKSQGHSNENIDAQFIRDKIDKGHLSVIEHSLVTVKIICDRGVSDETVRHRLASYSQESTRSCNYSKDKFGNEITVIAPCFWNKDSAPYGEWEIACRHAEKAYFNLLENNATAQEARSVLPNSLKTEIMVSMNFREWRHFFELRLSAAAHPQMRQVAGLILKEIKLAIPVIFDDFGL
jgi:thymidylate synthase (FAD)